MIGTKRTRVRCDRTYTCLHLIRIVTRLRLIVEQTLEDEDIDQSHEALRYQGEPQQWHPPNTQSESSKPIATSHQTSTSMRRVTQALPLVSTRPRRRGVLSSPFLSYQAKITSQSPPQSFISQPIIYQSSHAMKTITKCRLLTTLTQKDCNPSMGNTAYNTRSTNQNLLFRIANLPVGLTCDGKENRQRSDTSEKHHEHDQTLPGIIQFRCDAKRQPYCPKRRDRLE